MNKIKTVFLDRDGVLNYDSDSYIRKIEDIRMIPGTDEAIRLFTEHNMHCVIISNQSGIGRGYFTEDDAVKMFDFIISESEKSGGKILNYYFCPHKPEAHCECRKPKSLLFLKALERYQLLKENSIFIGDNNSDYLAAKTLGIPFYLVLTGKGKKTKLNLEQKGENQKSYPDLLVAAKAIIKGE